MSFQPKQNVIVLVSDQFSNRLVRGSLLDALIVPAANLAQMSEFMRKEFGAIGLLDIDPNSNELSHRVQLVQQTNDYNTNCAVFAVGSPILRQFVQELLIFGFTDVFCSQAETDRLRRSATRFWASLQWPKLPLEDRILSNLPWQAVGQLNDV